MHAMVEILQTFYIHTVPNYTLNEKYYAKKHNKSTLKQSFTFICDLYQKVRCPSLCSPERTTVLSGYLKHSCWIWHLQIITVKSEGHKWPCLNTSIIQALFIISYGFCIIQCTLHSVHIFRMNTWITFCSIFDWTYIITVLNRAMIF